MRMAFRFFAGDETSLQFSEFIVLHEKRVTCTVFRTKHIVGDPGRPRSYSFLRVKISHQNDFKFFAPPPPPANLGVRSATCTNRATKGEFTLS